MSHFTTQNQMQLVEGTDLLPSQDPGLSGIFYHLVGTQKLYISLQTESAENQWFRITDVDQNTARSPHTFEPDDRNLSVFYHPLGTNLLYINDKDAGWINLTGPTAGFNDVVFYVDSINGHDDGNGTVSSPFQTLGYAYSQIPKSPFGLCQIRLLGAGPYTIPQELQGVTPGGELGQPLIICGDTNIFVNSLAVASASANVITVTVNSLTPNQYRGLLFECTSGANLGRTFQIAENGTNTITLLNVPTESVVAGDVFFVEQPGTSIIGGDITITGPGKVAFWKCNISIDNIYIAAQASVLFDACVMTLADASSIDLNSICQCLPVSESPDFDIITDAGTQGGATGLYTTGDTTLTISNNSLVTGYYVSKVPIVLNSASSCIFRGCDFDLTGSSSSTIFTISENSLLKCTEGFHYFSSAGADSNGIDVSRNSIFMVESTATITNCGLNAVIVRSAGVLDIANTSGSAGNGLGISLLNGGMLINSGGNALTGTTGSVLIAPGATAINWNAVGSYRFAPESDSPTASQGPIYYVDPVNGSDANSGTIGSPFLTISKPLALLGAGWYGWATINLRAGICTFNTSTIIPRPLGNTSDTAGGLLINGVDNFDSGLGTKTASGGTTGSGATFGTVVVAGGGLTVNAYRGYFLRFTSQDALTGHVYLIEQNSSTTITVEGAIDIAPTNQTFVIETPAAAIAWPNISQTISGYGSILGLQNLRLESTGGATFLRLQEIVVGVQKVQFLSLGSQGLVVGQHSSLVNLTGLVDQFPNAFIRNRCGAYFNFNALLSMTSTSRLNLLNCLFDGVRLEAQQVGWIQIIDSTFRGNAWIRALFGSSIALSRFHFDTVTPVPTDPDLIGGSGAAIVLSKGATGSFENGDISNTPSTNAPGDAILVEDKSSIQMISVTGTGNAGVGTRVVRASEVVTNSLVTLTGTLGNMKCGTAAIAAWPASATVANAGEFCLVVGT